MVKFWQNSKYFQTKLTGAGFYIGVTVTPITSVMIGDPNKARAFSKSLFDNGVFGMAISSKRQRPYPGNELCDVFYQKFELCGKCVCEDLEGVVEVIA